VSECVSEEGYSSPTWLYTILHFSHDRSNRSSPQFSSTSIQNFPFMSDLLSKLSKFWEHKTFSSNCTTSPVSTLNLSPICWWKQSSTCWMLLLPWQSWIQSHVYILRHLLPHYTNMSIKSNKLQLYTVYYICKPLYMFRVVSPPIIRNTNNCIYSIWY